MPADLYGLRDRGRLTEGSVADIVVLDPARVALRPLETRFDLPAGAGRLYSEPEGIAHVIVGGIRIAVDGRYTGDTAGRVLRSGRDTATPSLT